MVLSRVSVRGFIRTLDAISIRFIQIFVFQTSRYILTRKINASILLCIFICWYNCLSSVFKLFKANKSAKGYSVRAYKNVNSGTSSLRNVIFSSCLCLKHFSWVYIFWLLLFHFFPSTTRWDGRTDGQTTTLNIHHLSSARRRETPLCLSDDITRLSEPDEPAARNRKR